MFGSTIQLMCQHLDREPAAGQIEQLAPARLILRRQLTHIVHDEFEMRPCKLCLAKGHVGWRERESWKWGGALKSYRLNNGLSLAQMYYAVCLVPEHVNQLEQ